MQFYLVSALIFSLLVAIFAVQNTEVVVVRLLGMQSSVSLVLVILGSAAIGAIVIFFLSLFKQVKNWKALKQVTSQKSELEKQVAKLELRVNELESNKNSAPAKANEGAPLQSDNTKQPI